MTKVTKRSLLTSALALVVCVSMLIGTTYAWFTDSVTSTNNIITSGNLDVELYWSTNASDWEAVDANTNVFTNQLWEPGHTEVVYLKVVNEGTLALKYNLGVNIFSETTGINAAGETFKLSDYIEFGVIETGVAFADRDAARAAVTDAKIISKGYTKAASLEKTEENYVALVVYMPETVGNVANYKTGTNAPVINLGINLFATQYTFENDSFDEFYDGGAIWQGGVDYSWYDEDATELTIGSAEQLAGFAALVNGTAESLTTFAANSTPIVDSFAGQTIKLTSDIDLNGLAWTPIGNWDNAFEGNFDGQGHTISNLYINDATGEGIGFFGVVAGSEIKNVTLKNVDVNGYSMVAALVGAAYPAVISNCHVTGDINVYSEWAYVGGIASYCYYGTQVDGCSVIADAMGSITSATRNGVGGITAWLLEGDHKVTNCTVKNLNLTGWTNVGSITGFVHYNNTIEGCTAENIVLTKTRGDGNPGIGIVAGGYSYSANNAITIKNNTIKDITLNGTHIAYSTYNTLYGSEYGGATEANFVLEDNTVSGITNNLVIVKVIKNVAELKNALANGGEYTLGADIALTETLTVANGVDVVIYMNGKTISGTLDGTGTKDLFLVKGNLTLKNGSIDLTATVNQGWNAMSSIFDITAGGAVTLDNVVAENKGGTDMNFVAHLNNWGTASLNVNNSTLKATYVPVRVFNSGYDVNNVTIENSVIDGGNHSFWVHNYTSADFGGKLASGSKDPYDEVKVKARLNFDILGNGNTFKTGKPSPIRYGMTGSIYFNDEGVFEVSTIEALQNAINNDVAYISIAKDLTGDVTVTQKPDVKITIDGNGNTFAGVLLVDGKSATYTTAGLTVKNVVFKADSISADACIQLGNGNNATRYTCNVTVDGCTFDVPGAVGVKSYTGGDKNLVIKNSTATANAHSLLQAAGIDGITVEGCEVYSKNGANFNNSTDVTVIGSTFDVQGYAVRFGAGSAATGDVESYLIKDCNLKSACAESGDAVIVLRGSADKATLTITNTTITGTPDIINNAQNATVVK